MNFEFSIGFFLTLLKARICGLQTQNCVILMLVYGENYPLPAWNIKVKYPTRPGKKYETPNPLDTRKFQKMKYPTHSIPGNSLPDPSLDLTKKIVRSVGLKKNIEKFH